MTPHEIELALALKGLGWVGSRFTGSIAYMAVADPQRELSLRQRYYMEIMAWRYRRQLPRHLQPDEKPLNMPRRAATPKKSKPSKDATPAAVAELPLFATSAVR